MFLFQVQFDLSRQYSPDPGFLAQPSTFQSERELLPRICELTVTMKINSNAIGIETPVKENVVGDSSSLKLAETKRERYSPSSELEKMLFGIDRLHKFCHRPELDSIENIKMTLKFRNLLRELVSDLNDEVSDWIKELEDISTQKRVFSEFVQDYIHYEYCVKKTYSFTIFLILNYMKKFSLGVEESFVEVLYLRFDKTVCPECCSSVSPKDTNLTYLKQCAAEDCISDQLDSDNDPDFDTKTALHTEGEVSSDSDNIVTPKKLTGEQYTAKEKLFYCNPFDSDQDVDDDVYDFETDYQKEEVPLVPRTSSVEIKKKKFICDHCQKVFTNGYNLKLHLVQVHRIEIPGIKALRCPDRNCQFTTGSRICFTRHMETHRLKPKYVKKTDVKVTCSYCGVDVANDSSLKRHIKRKHKR